MTVEGCLIQSARFTVNSDKKGLEAHRRDVLSEVLGDEGGNPLDAGRRLHHVLELDGAVEDGVELVDVSNAFGIGEDQELALERLPVDAEVRGSESVVELDGGAVLDRLGDRVLVEVALRVVLAENLEGALRPWQRRSIGVPVKPM